MRATASDTSARRNSVESMRASSEARRAETSRECVRKGSIMSSVTYRSLVVPAAAAVMAGVGIGAVSQSPAPVVKIDSGGLQGSVADGVVSFKGIPFAAPPIGELRWRPPQPVAKWSGVRPATEFGANCMQGRFGPPPTAAPGSPAPRMPSEDCLYLNVWRPEDGSARNLPVMVWIYGGASPAARAQRPTHPAWASPGKASSWSP